MTKSAVSHATFVIERDLKASPARVFAAFADPKLKTQWFKGPDEWGPDEHAMDFRAGGRETSKGGPPGGFVSYFESTYHVIIPDSRLVYAYDMYVDGKMISVSLATVEFQPSSSGTHLVLTEHGAYFDAADGPALREHGTGWLLDNMVKVVDG